MSTTHSRTAGKAMLSPAVILLFLWMIVPLGMTLYFSFLRYNLLIPGTRSRGSRITSTFSPTLHSLKRWVIRRDRWGCASRHRGRWHISGDSHRPAHVGPGYRQVDGDRALFRHADRVRPGVEEHVHASGQRPCSPGSLSQPRSCSPSTGSRSLHFSP